MFRLALLFLGTMMLIFDAIAFAIQENSFDSLRQLYPELQEDDKGYYALYFLPDLFTMALYTLILVLVYRRNRSVGISSATVVRASSSPSFSVWSILRILFTLFLSGFMLYKPVDEINWTRAMVRQMEKVAERMGRDNYLGFNALYFCGTKPTSANARGIEVIMVWLYNGCMIKRTRSFIAILVGFLILVELTLSLKKAHAKNKTVSPQKLAFENEKQ